MDSCKSVLRYANHAAVHSVKLTFCDNFDVLEVGDADFRQSGSVHQN